jgi:hypothetical protein|tara:strand:- start:991 stop:1167 length:177 start_codon:yes stop_codon:yes gene_type:complete
MESLDKKQIVEFVDNINNIIYEFDKQTQTELVIDVLVHLREARKLIMFYGDFKKKYNN